MEIFFSFSALAWRQKLNISSEPKELKEINKYLKIKDLILNNIQKVNINSFLVNGENLKFRI